MKEWPILFTGEMVRAILSGQKTQTRRVGGIWAKVRPGDRLWVRETWGYRGAGWSNQRPDRHEVTIHYQATDERRTFLRYGDKWDAGLPRQRPPPAPRHDLDFDAIEARNNYFSRWWKSWRPSIFLPRWASRELLEVVSNRDEPLQEISEEDARAEGVVLHTQTGPLALVGRPWATEYRALWDSINGHRAPWESNPRPQAITFRRLPGAAPF